MYLVALLPPSNVRRQINELQVSLFREGSDPAALALPPHLPLAFYDDPPNPPLGTIQRNALESRGFLLNSPWLLLELVPEEELKRLRALLPKEGTPDWVPTGSGIPIARDAGSPSLPAGRPPVLRWKTSHLICLELITKEPHRWWEQLEYSEIWRVKLKRHIE